MSYADSDARCIKAFELTFRFLLSNLVYLFFLLFAVCVVFKGYWPGVYVGYLIVFSYFTVAYNCYGRGNKASLIIAALAGLTVAGTGTAAAVCRVSDDEEDSESDFATGFVASGFDAMGNPNGFDMSSNMMSSSNASMSDDFHHSFNTANGLPMINDMVDIHGNIFGTTFMDDMTSSSTSAFDDNFSHSSDDSFSHSSFDSSFSCSSGFDDDWNN